MKHFLIIRMKITVPWLLLLFVLVGAGDVGRIWLGRYCNERFGFCLKYPESLLPHRQELPGGIGIGLQPYDRSGLVTARADVYGANYSPREYFAAQLAVLPATSQGISIIDTIFGADYYEALFTWEDESLFHQAFFFDTHCVVLIARVPLSKPWLLRRIREDVKLEFPRR
jgi:hypothetical protein